MYNEIYAKLEQPKWRAELIKEHGPAGISTPYYNNLSRASMWKWDIGQFGNWSVDCKREVTYDGVNFMQKQSDGVRRSISIEDWLKKKALKSSEEHFRYPSSNINERWYTSFSKSKDNERQHKIKYRKVS